MRRSTDDGIQLITAQKAKGSEWQAVILPFLSRNVISAWPRYPSVIKIPGSNDSLVALTKDDFPEEVRTATKTAVQQEMARLLYVATTRARHTLVLALDEEIFARPNGEMQNGAQLKCLLGEGQVNRPQFETLGLEPTVCAKTARAGEQEAAKVEATVAPLRPINREELKLARQRAASFTRKFNPSGYDEEKIQEPPNGKPFSSTVIRSAADTPATVYGRWWHEFMQQIPWHDEKSWKQTFEAHQPRSPVPARSAKEWQLFLRCLKSDPDFSERLTRQEWVAHPEMPFFWRVNENTCLEGVVDLALINRANSKWLILDWKTNRIRAEETDDLRKQYRHNSPPIGRRLAR